MRGLFVLFMSCRCGILFAGLGCFVCLWWVCVVLFFFVFAVFACVALFVLISLPIYNLIWRPLVLPYWPASPSSANTFALRSRPAAPPLSPRRHLSCVLIWPPAPRAGPALYPSSCDPSPSFPPASAPRSPRFRPPPCRHRSRCRLRSTCILTVSCYDCAPTSLALVSQICVLSISLFCIYLYFGRLGGCH